MITFQTPGRARQHKLTQRREIKVREEEVWTEEYRVDSGDLDWTIRDIIREGNARRIIVKNARGKTVVKVRATLGVAALLSNPRILVLGALMARKGPLTVIVERIGEKPV